MDISCSIGGQYLTSPSVFLNNYAKFWGNFVGQLFFFVMEFLLGQKITRQMKQLSAAIRWRAGNPICIESNK